MNVLRTYGTVLRIPWTPRFSDRGSNGKASRLGSRVERRLPGAALSAAASSGPKGQGQLRMLKISVVGWRAGGSRDHAQGQDRHAAGAAATCSGDRDHAPAKATGRAGAALGITPLDHQCSMKDIAGND